MNWKIRRSLVFEEAGWIELLTKPNRRVVVWSGLVGIINLLLYSNPNLKLNSLVMQLYLMYPSLNHLFPTWFIQCGWEK